MAYTNIPPDARKLKDANGTTVGFVWKNGRRWHSATLKRATRENFATEREAEEAVTAKKSHAKKVEDVHTE